MAESEFEKTYLSSPRVDMTAHIGEPRRDPVEDAARNAKPEGDPPVPGAQWDEVHRRWEVWNEEKEEWDVVGGDEDDGVAPADENPLPSHLARELIKVQDLEAATEQIPDYTRAAEPPDGPPGAQWNEIVSRWERWDEATNAWVEAT